ncbi:lipocalin family protein [Flavobacterium sp.]
MRKIKVTMLAVLSGLAFSCSSDDGATTSGDLTTRWYNKETRVLGETLPYDDHEECGKDYLQFNDDGTGVFVDIYLCDTYSDPFTYIRSGNDVTITDGSFSETARIIELSDSTLKVKLRYDYDDDGDEEDVIEVYTRN